MVPYLLIIYTIFFSLKVEAKQCLSKSDFGESVSDVLALSQKISLTAFGDKRKGHEFDLSPEAMDSICQVIKYNGMADDSDYLYYDLDMWEKAILTNYMKLDHTNEDNLKPLIDYMKKNFHRFKCAGVDVIKRETGILELMLLKRDYEMFNRFLSRYQPGMKSVCDPAGRNMLEMIDHVLLKGYDGQGTFLDDQKERIQEIREKIYSIEKGGYSSE
jgi:hypothetical protein